jgi:hypothetical protein
MKWDDMMRFRPANPYWSWHSHPDYPGPASPFGSGDNLFSGEPGGKTEDTGFAEKNGVSDYLITPAGPIFGYNPSNDQFTSPLKDRSPKHCQPNCSGH